MSSATETSFASPLSRFHHRIEEKAKDGGVRPVLIVALGDSVTQGAGYDNDLMHGRVYHGQLKELLEERYKLSTFSVINSGVGGETAEGGIARLDRDVIRYQPDLVLIAFGLNEAGSMGLDGLEQFTANIKAIINRIRTETKAEIILLTTNMMPTHDNPNIPDRWRHVAENFITYQTTGVLKAYANRIHEIGQEENIPVADVYAGWEELAAKGVDTTAMLLNGLNHPDAAGHRMAGEIVMNVIKAHEPQTSPD